MNWDQKQGNWMQSSGKVREMWGKLIDDEETTNAGKRDQIAALLQRRYGDALEKAAKQSDKLAT
jgi:uncharacterized protein YjbJ (UPF0337 family)